MVEGAGCAADAVRDATLIRTKPHPDPPLKGGRERDGMGEA